MNALLPLWLRDDPRQWRPGALDRAALNSAAAALACRPDFHVLMRRFAACWLQTQADNPELRAVFRNTQRYLLLVASVALHHRRDPADPGSGLTRGRLLDFFREVAPATASAGQVKAMLAHARLHGLIEPLPGRGDGRVRPLQPTRLLLGTMQHWVGGFLRAMAGIDELALPASAAVLFGQPCLVPEVFSYRVAAMQYDRFVLSERQPMLSWVLAHDGGYSVFLHMLREAEPLGDGSALVPLTAGELARRAGVSRGTVRNLLDDAAVLGWMDSRQFAAGWRLADEAMAVARHWVALELVWMHGLVRAAWATVTSCSARSQAA